MNNRLRKHRMTVVEVFGLTRPAWPSRQSQIRFRGGIDGIKPGEVLARLSQCAPTARMTSGGRIQPDS